MHIDDGKLATCACTNPTEPSIISHCHLYLLIMLQRKKVATAEYEYSASELKVEADIAYGTNLTNNEVNQADYDLIEPNRAHDNSATEVDQAYELDNIIDIVANDSELKTEENTAYGSKLSAELNNNNEVIATDENIAYGQYNQLEEAADI